MKYNQNNYYKIIIINCAYYIEGFYHAILSDNPKI